MNDGGNDDEALLNRLGQWLRETRVEASQFSQNGSSPINAAEAAPDVGLYRLVEEFTALRHEVKLQTRSSRALEDQAETLATSLRQAIDALRSIEPKEAQAAWSAGKALATILAELDDALDRGRQQTEKVVMQLAEETSGNAAALATDFHVSQSWFSRLLHGGYHRRLLAWIDQAADPLRRAALLEALLDGYRLIQKRLAQALAAEGILRIDAVGRPVDPEQMVVVDVVDSDELPGGVVYDELRRGYTWNGRVLRYAEVRATRAV